MIKRLLCFTTLWALIAIPGLAADFELGKITEAAPDDVSSDIIDVLAGEALQLKDGDKPQFSFWFVKELPLKAAPESSKKALDQIADVTLVGVVAAHVEHRDYRDDEIYDDIYTMRFGVRPEDGDHQGTSEFLYFLVLTPVQLDEDVEGFDDMDELAEVSGEETATGHPIVLSVRPVNEPAAELPALTAPVDKHKAMQLTLPAKIKGGDTTQVTFEIVYEGIGHL